MALSVPMKKTVRRTIKHSFPASPIYNRECEFWHILKYYIIKLNFNQTKESKELKREFNILVKKWKITFDSSWTKDPFMAKQQWHHDFTAKSSLWNRLMVKQSAKEEEEQKHLKNIYTVTLMMLNVQGCKELQRQVNNVSSNWLNQLKQWEDCRRWKHQNSISSVLLKIYYALQSRGLQKHRNSISSILIKI
jgi:hypothetical protein